MGGQPAHLLAQLTALDLAPGTVIVAGDQGNTLVVLGTARLKQVLGVAEVQVGEERGLLATLVGADGVALARTQGTCPLEKEGPELAEILDREGVE